MSIFQRIFGPKKPKTAILTIHGFGTNLHHHYDYLSKYFEAFNIPVIQFDIYDVDNPNDDKLQDWISRCETQMLQTRKEYEEIILIGFSMGGVIASYLASIYKVKQLILVAPAFQYLDLGKVGSALYSWATKDASDFKPSVSQTSCFQQVVSNYKECISQVDCPVLFLHGSEDEVISVESSRNAYKKVSGKKLLLVIEGASHKMLYNNTVQDTLFEIIHSSIKGKLF
ncbi:MAG: YqiA/YcfP family alpha/beta fold hydrolase [Bacillota bacterium]|nr:YqiA/YcfP family alpha/beta fold hydrolase [Bacillota bacterium]